MRRQLRKLLSVILFLLIFPAAPALAGPVEKYTLDNKLDVILIENHRAPVVSLMVWVKAGSSSERPGEYGLAHLMEHMLFKGTARRGPGRIAREVAASGGSINAYTSYDQTVYHIDMAGRFAARGLDILADMVFDPSLDPVEFAREKEVVIEEIKRGRDMPERKLSKAVFARAFQVHPYGRPIIGFASSIREVSRKTALGFHRRWYKPGNMILIAAGDFRPSELRTLIEQTYGRAREGKAPIQVRPPEPAQNGLRTVIQQADVKTARLELVFHIPEFKSEETTAVDLLASILGQGRTSRLYRRVKREKELVHTISAGAYTPQDPGLFFINAELDPDKAEAALAAVMAEVAAMSRSSVGPDELTRARLNLEAEFIHSRATMSGEARTAGYFEALAGDYQAKDRYLAALARVTAGDLQRAAARYLKPENMTVGGLFPREDGSTPDEKAVSRTVTKGWAKVRPSPTAPAQVKIIKYKLKNGATLLIKPDHSLPLVAVRAAFLGGLRYETAENNGLNSFLTEVWDRGTTHLSADELARAVEDMAGELSSFSGRNSLGLEAEFLSGYLDQGLKLFTEVLTSPALSPAEVEKARPNILAAIKRRQDRLPARTFLLFARTLYQDHPYGRDMLGAPDVVRGLGPRDLESFYKKWVRPANMVLSVVGDVEPDRTRSRLEELLGGWTGQTASPPVISPPRTWKGLRKKSEAVQRAQAHLILGFPAPGIKSPDRCALEVLDAILSAMGGRLFVELRDKQSLAYALNSFYRPGLGAGSFGLYIAFDPAKIDRVRTGLREVLAGLTKNDVSAEELARAKEYILGSFEIGLQTYSAQASNLTFNQLYGLGYDYDKRYLAGINAVSAADVGRAARKYLDLERAVEVTVGKLMKE